MSKNVQCPGCDIDLRYGYERDGKPGICPACGHLILPPEGKGSESSTDAREVRKLDGKIDDLIDEGKALARENDIRLNKGLDPEFDNKKQVEVSLGDLQRDLPETPSAYQPSGKMPSAAFGMMLSGTGIAVVAALLAELVVGAISAVIIGVMVAINVAIMAIGCVWCFAVVLFVIIGFFAIAAPFFTGGWAAAWVTTKFGRMGKNRNEHVAALLSMASTAVSIAILWIVFAIFGTGQLDNFNPAELGASTLHWIGHGVMFVGGLFAVFVAWAMAASYVQEAKFCEECEEFMEETELKSLRIGAIHGMAQALKDDKVPIAASMLCVEKGEDGKAMLFHCPSCHAGYVELTVVFKAKWKEEGEDQVREETWRVASAPLDEYEVEWFRIFKDEAGDDGIEDVD